MFTLDVQAQYVKSKVPSFGNSAGRSWRCQSAPWFFLLNQTSLFLFHSQLRLDSHPKEAAVGPDPASLYNGSGTASLLLNTTREELSLQQLLSQEQNVARSSGGSQRQLSFASVFYCPTPPAKLLMTAACVSAL